MAIEKRICGAHCSNKINLPSMDAAKQLARRPHKGGMGSAPNDLIREQKERAAREDEGQTFAFGRKVRTHRPITRRAGPRDTLARNGRNLCSPANGSILPNTFIYETPGRDDASSPICAPLASRTSCCSSALRRRFVPANNPQPPHGSSLHPTRAPTRRTRLLERLLPICGLSPRVRVHQFTRKHLFFFFKCLLILSDFLL